MKALITIFDEETGEEIVKDLLISPSAEDMDYDTMIKTYAFEFKTQRIEEHKEGVDSLMKRGVKDLNLGKKQYNILRKIFKK